MSIKTSRTILKITGFLTLIPGILLLLAALVMIFGGGASAMPDYGIDIESTVDIGAGIIAGIGIIALVYAVILLLRAWASFAAAKDSRKYFFAWILALIDMVRCLADAYNKISAGTFDSGSVLGLFLTVALNVLIFVAANTIRNDSKRYV